jgi:hypothetical protein
MLVFPVPPLLPIMQISRFTSFSIEYKAAFYFLSSVAELRRAVVVINHIIIYAASVKHSRLYQ